jgi:hypothetical protein
MKAVEDTRGVDAPLSRRAKAPDDAKARRRRMVM